MMQKQKEIRQTRFLTKVLFFTVIISIISCKNGVHDEVMSYYDNGNAKTVFEINNKQKDNPIRVGEKGYYEDGQLMYYVKYKDGKPYGESKFYYANGQLFASGDFTRNHEVGEGWKFYNAEGAPLHEKEYDSVVVLECAPNYHPVSVTYHSGNEETRYRFNENYTLNAKGLVVDGKKEGRWEFYYANGQLLLEANYQMGVENGLYNSYRENGVPYFRGYCINGKRANEWEVYDEAGNLVAKQNYD